MQKHSDPLAVVEILSKLIEDHPHLNIQNHVLFALAESITLAPIVYLPQLLNLGKF